MMIKLLFVNEKWTANTKEYGNSSSEHILYSAFQSTGLGIYKTFHMDEYYYEHTKRGDYKLIEEVMDFKPDLMVYSWLVGAHNPDTEAIKIIHKLGTKIACIWWDFSWKPCIQMAEELSPFVDMHIIMDNPFITFQIPMHSKRKHLQLWTPNDPNLYFGDVYSERAIDLYFSGDIFKDARKDYVQKLRSMGEDYNIYIGQGKEKRMSVQEYTNTLRKVKIIPNFTEGSLKGRVFEATLCGALLMEPENSVTKAYFIPNQEYVEYNGIEDFSEKVKYYLENTEERLKIAEAGNKRALENYNVKRFWSIIFHKLGLMPFDINQLYNLDKEVRLQIDMIIENAYVPAKEES